jgi:hypothetical protein
MDRKMEGLLTNSLRDSARAISWNRREFLRSTVGIGTPAALLGFSRLRALAIPRKKKAVVVTFGGGARDEETFAPEGQENIPHLLNTLAPQSTFFTQVVNRGILGHYVATASLATGVYEAFNNFRTQEGFAGGGLPALSQTPASRCVLPEDRSSRCVACHTCGRLFPRGPISAELRPLVY